eukprot:gene11673-4909_t
MKTFPLHFHVKIDTFTYLPVSVYCIKANWYNETHQEELQKLLKKFLNEKLILNDRKTYKYQKENSLEIVKGKLIEFQYEFKSYPKYSLILENKGNYTSQKLTEFELILTISQTTSIMKNFVK